MDTTATPVLTLTHEGTPTDHKGRTVKIGRTWDVHLDGTLIGTVTHRMATRERGARTARYVTARWSTPAYFWHAAGSTNAWEGTSRTDCVRSLVADTIRKATR